MRLLFMRRIARSTRASLRILIRADSLFVSTGPTRTTTQHKEPSPREGGTTSLSEAAFNAPTEAGLGEREHTPTSTEATEQRRRIRADVQEVIELLARTTGDGPVSLPSDAAALREASERLLRIAGSLDGSQPPLGGSKAGAVRGSLIPSSDQEFDERFAVLLAQARASPVPPPAPAPLSGEAMELQALLRYRQKNLPKAFAQREAFVRHANELMTALRVRIRLSDGLRARLALTPTSRAGTVQFSLSEGSRGGFFGGEPIELVSQGT
jgi:hypothetical protein